MSTISGFSSAVTGINRGMDGIRRNSQTIATQGASGSVSDEAVTGALVDLKTNSLQVEASAKVLSTQNEILGTLLDELA